MQFRGKEDRLNPIAPPGADETTLGGYPAVHGRAPAFEGSDGRAYTVAIEVEPADDVEDAWVGYLVFVRWADGGTAVMGHLETEDLTRGTSEEEARQLAEALSLVRVKQLLDETIARKEEWEAAAGEIAKDQSDESPA